MTNLMYTGIILESTNITAFVSAHFTKKKTTKHNLYVNKYKKSLIFSFLRGN